MRKILLSFLLLGITGVSLFAATSGFFSDTETSTENRLEAGSIDLQIDNTSYYNGEVWDDTTWGLADLNDGGGPGPEGAYLFFDFDDLKPGDWGEDTISLHVESNPAWVCVDFTLTENDDNGSVEPELTAGDDEDDEGDLFDGELAQELNFIFWADDGDNVLEEDEIEDILIEGNALEVLNSSWPIADSTFSINEGPLSPDETHYIGKAWCFGELTKTPVSDDNGVDPTVDPGIECNGAPLTNITQTDSILGDIQFSAVQDRNNLNFECDVGCEETGEAFATGVDDFNQALRKNGTAVNADRSDPNKALGPPDWPGSGTPTFFSLGFGGSIVVTFDSSVHDVDGVDLSFHEVTNGRSTYPEENALIEVSKNGTDWFSLGTISNRDGGDGISYKDISGTGLSTINYVRITDTTNPDIHSNTADGYDLDAVDGIICIDDLEI